MSHQFAIQIKERARELGFAACGIAAAAPPQPTFDLEKWLSSGFHAGMDWMKRPESIAKRADIREVFPGAQSVIVLALNYRTDAPFDEEKHGKIARYARGLDYHDIFKARGNELLSWIQSQQPCAGRMYSDSAPILEHAWAQRAGIGWVGKNTLVMSRELGSYFLLGELVLDIELPPDAPYVQSFCGTCTACLDACPTDAFSAPRVLDANKCISYHTIENREVAPIELRENFQDNVFGCDICQQVCPWNRKNEAKVSAEPQLWTRDLPGIEEWTNIPQEEFSARLKGSPIKRAKRRGMRRNAARALKNRKSHKK
ncbi:epoxyqueuosine reductase [Abditibacterium utsteinense]|uniref:Epoxyqueuosine reductase n=1 Tax=Abditibacterium utsteinense TaxID=1960156 RepID=A0A2S8SSG6_9BACT|nr:tRNA epoxyqueuosine(34) reductase QueG [Abditibacterium utsteinense]PQV63718.1 epoxyqueuosine reductase [Abditibacterium utsteinense]